MSTFQRIGLLLWKNFTLKKRHYIVTSCEILLPTIFAIAMGILYGEINKPDRYYYYEPNPPGKNVTYHDEFTGQHYMNSFTREFKTMNETYYPVILYAPKNAETDEIIRLMNVTYQELYDNIEWEEYENCSDIYTNCTKGVWRGEESELELEALALDYFTEKRTSTQDFPNGRLEAAIVFPPDMTVDTNGKFSYKLRFPEGYFETDRLFDRWNNYGPGSIPYEYRSTFTGLQLILDQAFIQFKSGRTSEINVSVQGFPYPEYERTDDFTDSLKFFYTLLLPQCLILSFLTIIPSIMGSIVNEKQTGVHELLALMGLPNWMHWLGYLVSSMMVLTISVTIVVIIFFVPFNGGAGAMFEHSDPTLWWILLILYAVALTTFCFFISTFFQRPALAITGGIVLYMLTYYGVAIPLLQTMESLNIGIKLAICLIPNNALHFATLIMGERETIGTGGHWSLIGKGVNDADDFGLYLVMIMLLVDTFLYGMLSLYLEKIIPSPFGLRKSWYYIFLPSEWGLGKKSVPGPTFDEPDVTKSSDQDSDAFEKGPSNGKVGIEIKNLRKEFDGSVAVAGMNLKMYEGQITALLGQNGAGKTTTMSMLTGMFAPTSGTAYINGYNIRTEMEKVREDLALCPQHNMLFNQLSVKENLVFFGRLNGLTAKEANDEAVKLLEQLRLQDKTNNLSVSLSGGQKRKLSLGCALITGSKVVMLDEPTSGLDVENRRMLWDLLLEFRIGRTIVLTTHFMEEADVLGDRIAIMDQGELICAGTPMFLKNYYGTGYILKLSVHSNKLQGKILDLVQTYIPGAAFCKQGSGSSHELPIAIPTTDNSKFPELFLNLSAKKSELGIQSFGLAQTTMDDVFVRVGEINAANHNSTVESYDPLAENNNSFGEFTRDGPTKKISGFHLIFQQLLALLKKRTIYALRRPVVLLFQVIIPIPIIVAAILITNTTFYEPENRADPPLTMSLDPYNETITSIASNPENLDIAGIYERVVGESAVRVSTDDLEAYYLSVGRENLEAYRNQHIVGVQMNSTNIKAMHSTVAKHAMPLSVNFVMSTLLQKITGNSMTFEVTNHPFYDDYWDIHRVVYIDELPSMIFMVLVPVGLVLLTSTLVILPIEERRNSAKQIQLMTGLDSIVYWLSFFTFDFLFLCIVSGIMIACFPIFENYKLFTSNGGAGVAFMILVAYAFQTVPFSYLITLVVKSVPGGFSLATILSILTSGGLCMMVGGLISLTRGSAIFLSWISRIFPGYSLASALGIYAQTSLVNVQCNLFTEELKERVCVLEDGSYGYNDDVKACCPQCGTDGFPPCFEMTPYWNWTSNENFFSQDNYPGILQDVIVMFIMGILNFLLLIIIEKGIIRQLRKQLSKASEFFFAKKTRDEDVNEEKERVEKLVSDGKTNEDALVVNNFCKNFGTFSAISNVNFGVHHGECFGLLGVNGAGKTTTFRILTGDENPSKGNAFAGGSNLERDRSRFLKSMGYCPQFDGIVGVLTGNEMLELFGGLRGIPRKAISQEVSKWMSKMGLSKSGKIECRNYSGGMKRRLSSAMAMIGEPKIVLLDEPTTGVDPVARREFWKIITSLKKAGQAVVLTSHSMEECEKLCTRLAIMVNGEFQCLGGVQHLKDKFAKGYSLTLKLKFMAEEIGASRLNDLKQKIVDGFTPCSLKDEHQNILEYHLTNTNLEWAFLFGRMESLRSEFSEILEDYAINQTTLEEVFLSFARQQYPERKAKVSRFKNLCSCFKC